MYKNTLPQIALVALFILILFDSPHANSITIKPVSTQSDYIYGSLTAPVSIIMYSDFSCAYCKKLRLTLKKLINDSSGQINWVYRHFPLEINFSASIRQANAIHCAGKTSGNDSFWELTNQLFNLPQPKPENIDQHITLAALKSNLNVKDLLDCVDKNTFKQRIIEDQKEAQRLGFNGTPGLVFVNNKNNKTIIKQGALTLRNLTQFSHQLLNN